MTAAAPITTLFDDSHCTIVYSHKDAAAALPLRAAERAWTSRRPWTQLYWHFLQDVLWTLGFSLKWTNKISSILATYSSRIPSMGSPVRISSMPWVATGKPIVAFAFHSSLQLTQSNVSSNWRRPKSKGMLQLVLPRARNLRWSLYVEDTTIFANPSATKFNCI